MPESCSLYRHFAADGTLLYVGIALNELNRLAEHKQNAERYDKIARVVGTRSPEMASAEIPHREEASP